MESKEYNSRKGESRGIAAIITIVVSLFALVCCIIPAGTILAEVRYFLLGVFGIFTYILFVSLIAVCVLYLRGVKLKVSPKKAALLVAIFFMLLLTAHLFSTLKIFGETKTMAEYLSEVYKQRITAGGLLTGIIAYPIKALLSVWGSAVLYIAVIVFLSLAVLDFSVFKRKQRPAAVKPKEIMNFELSPEAQPREMHSSSVGSGLYVSKIQSSAGDEPGAPRHSQKQRGRLYSDIDKKEQPPYAPVDARTPARDKLYGYKPSFSPYSVPAEETQASVLGTENKPSAHETLFGGRRTSAAQGGAFANAGSATYNYGGFSGVPGYSGGSILPNKTIGEPVKSAPVKPAKIIHEPSSGDTGAAGSLAPNGIYDSSVTPRPRNNFGEYADNPNPIINGDFYSNKLEGEKFSEKKDEKYKASHGFSAPSYSKPSAPPVPETRASIAPSAPKSEPRREFNELDGTYRTGINPRNYESFSFSAEREKNFGGKEEGGFESMESRAGNPGKVISIFDSADEAEDSAKAAEAGRASNGGYGEPEYKRPGLRDLRPDPEISSGRAEDNGPETPRTLRARGGADFAGAPERVEDHTGYYETLPPERTERTRIEKFEDKVADIEKTFTELLQPAAGGDERDITPPPVREPIIRTPVTRSRLVKPDNQVRLIDYEAETANPERKEPLLQPVPYTPPMLTMLRTQSTDLHDSGVDYQAKAQMLENIMEEFRTPAKVIGITVGPAVTRYELQTAQGVSVKKIEGLAQDIAYNMACRHSVRIQSPIAGRQAVGIEVPNDKIAIVALRELIESREFMENKCPLTFAVGKDIAGKCIVDDLVNMTHVLIAGSTGSGKSACLNSLITSIIFKSSPDDVRLILIDPKRVEFNIYNGLPHLLLAEAVTEPEKAINAFSWAIDEMERRYRLFQSLKVGDIQEYNASPEVYSGQESKLPYIVIVVDELADLMMCNKKEVEEKIRRLSQKSRAAGIHLVIATQRPSVDVITGTIKTNLPSRMAFAVTNFADSKTILDQSGAENLLGRGDMLFSGKEMKEPIRVQGAFVTKAEVKAIVEEVKALNPSVYDEEAGKIINFVKQPEESSINADADEETEDVLLGEAVRLVIENGQASISMVQRRFSVGYARAARLIDQMELRKFISPFEGSKPRQVYITMQEWQEIFGEKE